MKKTVLSVLFCIGFLPYFAYAFDFVSKQAEVVFTRAESRLNDKAFLDALSIKEVPEKHTTVMVFDITSDVSLVGVLSPNSKVRHSFLHSNRRFMFVPVSVGGSKFCSEELICLGKPYYLEAELASGLRYYVSVFPESIVADNSYTGVANFYPRVYRERDQKYFASNFLSSVAQLKEQDIDRIRKDLLELLGNNKTSFVKAKNAANTWFDRLDESELGLYTIASDDGF